MKFLRFLPRGRGKLVGWLRNFRETLPLYEDQLKLDTQQLAQVYEFIDTLICKYEDMIRHHSMFVSDRSDVIRMQKEIHSVQGGLGCLINAVKANPDYNHGMGARLGIIGHSIPVTYDNYIPKLRAVFRGNQTVEVRFVRHYAQEVEIYSKRETEENFTLLARTDTSPYYDTRPIIDSQSTERRYYRIRLLIDRKEVGEPSDIAVVVMEK